MSATEITQIQTLRLSELTERIRKTIQGVFEEQAFWVIADVTSHNFQEKTGRHFFVLTEKEEGSNKIIAKIDAVAWGTASPRIKDFERKTNQKFRDGINVLVQVKIDYNASYGLKATLQNIDANYTIGALEQQKQQTLQKLLATCAAFIQKNGDFYNTRNNLLPLSRVIQEIAVISSSNSAGYEDFKHTLDNNNFGYRFNLYNYFTVVQGESNGKLIVQKLIEIYNSGHNYDVVVIIRGGGAQTDLLIFDDFELSRAVAKFPIPVITGIGHQRNETIVDMMAHTRTNAPTKVAEFIVAHNRKFEDELLILQKAVLIKSQLLFAISSQRLSALNSNIISKARGIIGLYKDELLAAQQVVTNCTKDILYTRRRQLLKVSNLLLARPVNMLSNKQNDLKNHVLNLKNYNRFFFQNQHGYLNHFTSVFKMMSPENILRKGFAIVYNKGKITASAEEISAGNDITILMADTEINATVNNKKQTDGTAFKL